VGRLFAFSNTQNDKEIATILDSYPVTPTAGFMWVEGLSGTHRTHEDLGVKNLSKKLEFRP
jgi:hypothetical protein